MVTFLESNSEQTLSLSCQMHNIYLRIWVPDFDRRVAFLLALSHSFLFLTLTKRPLRSTGRQSIILINSQVDERISSWIKDLHRKEMIFLNVGDRSCESSPLWNQKTICVLSFSQQRSLNKQHKRFQRHPMPQLYWTQTKKYIGETIQVLVLLIWYTLANPHQF